MNSLSFLHIPYPFYYKGKNIGVLIIIVFTLSLVFNFFFEPFEVNRNEHRMDFFWICVIHSAVATTVIATSLLIISRSVNKPNWKVWKELLLITFILLLVGIGQFLVRDVIYDNPHNWSLWYFYEEIRNTLLVGFLFVIILIPLNLLRLNAKHNMGISTMLQQITTNHDSDAYQPISIKNQDVNTLFVIHPETFLLARAEGNYIEVFTLMEHSRTKNVYRITLKDLESQIQNAPFLVKTHRSYLVNLRMIEHISGNAQGMMLRMKHFDDPIPVSRSRIDLFKQAMANFSS